ncbi:hypothetical protein AGABI1DRAFT_125144 [Agaricus bisporus var. burnettii JB137-S8]|uniref:Cyclin-D1-binding protein 1-like N-terminal domain-containing protein n=1 Tax=Agaricus bisporus var. burnettii (strain JB137-S8 / ATCC MYA-4627 / FGSC 10392) TaxID=597362 RepID=K5W773_AGABU|nr:uncharacterized protein AGABI1DRAFT_125144 [Agaricus bisporus var. burnettii JB137-S8]EKM82684.1 hypothetical protein AGABI1DRAFT_125144 [Agaricus bisporus var. burnettii JB137-S8]
MTDQKQQALVSLGLVLDTTEASLASLVNPAENPTQLSLDLSLLHKDFISILSFIYTSTTKLSLVLKSSSPSYKAALEPLKELSDRIASLPHCLRLIQTDHGKTLAAEATAIAKDVLQSARALFQILITIHSPQSASHHNAGDDYLIITGAVHEIVEKARSKDGFSKDNLAAVIKVWKCNQESLDDGKNEVQETLDSTEDQDDFDNGWDELGFTPGLKPSATEMERIKKIHAIARLSTLFHQRILQDVLKPLSSSLPLPSETNRILDNLAHASSDFLACSDNFVSTMYLPQVAVNMGLELDSYQRQLTHLQESMDPLILDTPSEPQLQGLQPSRTSKTPEHYAKLRKWCTACINQVNKNIHELARELKEAETPIG